MIRIIFLFVVLALVACEDSPTTPTEGTILPGIYHGGIVFTGASAGKRLSQEEAFNSDGTFSLKMYYSDSTTNCLVALGSATWTGTPNFYVLNSIKIEERNDCNSEFGPAELIPTDTTKIRNLNSTGFQEYYAPPNQQPIWVTYTKA